MATVAEIDRFLADFRYKLGFWGLLFQSRSSSKNLQTITDLELRTADVKSILHKLNVEDYSEGPKDDLLYKGAEMWVFGKNIKGREVYIKITLGRPGSEVICISFHFAEHSMNYPYKRN